jgi:restriction endonuclease Mrr
VVALNPVACDGSEVRQSLARRFELTPEELTERLPSGLARTFDKRIGWAVTYLYRVGLLARRLGLDVVYVQTKRWEATVGRPVVQGFVGALQGARASKGIIFTASSFSGHARSYAASVSRAPCSSTARSSPR